ncbi:hypothetical protein WN943_017779 [Citrus x changshan-huyou]|uniref:Uncharacterized protein n=1 Tax=Citrus sinensis TaxID=2711 RepID=A0A067HD45_CITSI|nr:hypothetical protein CISIN_1g047143mg [Citrus sinensis]
MRAVNVSADYCYLYEELRYSSWKDCKKAWAFLSNLEEASKKLRIFNADLNKPESFKGCMGIFHWAQPMVKGCSEEDEEVDTKLAVEGLLGALKG